MGRDLINLILQFRVFFKILPGGADLLEPIADELLAVTRACRRRQRRDLEQLALAALITLHQAVSETWERFVKLPKRLMLGIGPGAPVSANADFKVHQEKGNKLFHIKTAIYDTAAAPDQC